MGDSISDIGGDDPPAWLALAASAEPLDVRPLLAGGEDPFSALLERADKVEFGGLLVVDAPFNPAPLRRVLAARGFSSYGRRIGLGHWRVYFHLDGGQDWERTAESDVSPEGAMSWREEDGLHIDVRRLTPPQPMLAILRILDSLPAGKGLVVHHDRMPQLLIPELAERGWCIARVSEEMANIQLWLERVG
ncbi:MAG: DUF2249 domain-containing protein [Magnetospirillum sp.]|nr:DUF2249 domain-containing protein [Magnetospirillum sp.]